MCAIVSSHLYHICKHEDCTELRRNMYSWNTFKCTWQYVSVLSLLQAVSVRLYNIHTGNSANPLPKGLAYIYSISKPSIQSVISHPCCIKQLSYLHEKSIKESPMGIACLPRASQTLGVGWSYSLKLNTTMMDECMNTRRLL